MEIKLAILSGARAGEIVSFSQQTILVGRHADVDLRFDPANDLSVSTQHALLFFDAGSWHVRDLNSRNGTRVNDQRIDGEVPLQNRDRITFGAGGPTVQLEIVHAVAAGIGGGIPLPPIGSEAPLATPAEALPASSAGTTAPIPASPSNASNPSTLDRVRLELSRRTIRYRVALAALLLAAAATLTLVLVRGANERAAWDQERRAMRLEIDSVRSAGSLAIQALEDQLALLGTALRDSETRISDLTEAIAAAEGEGGDESAEVEGLRRELEEASAGLRHQQAAAGLDLATIQQRNRHAIARIFVETEDGEVVTGTAFAVRPDALLITSRHVLTDAAGRTRPRRIAIQFADSEQIWPARLVAVSDTDLAIVKVDNILGSVPTILGFNVRPDTLASGAPVAMIGFPDGGAAPGADDEEAYARPILAAGVMLEVTASRVQVQGYGALGASGSPILDGSGEVVAVVFGGRREPDGHSVFGVPATAAVRLLDALP